MTALRLLVSVLVLLGGCAGASVAVKAGAGQAGEKATTLAAAQDGTGDERCKAGVPGREVSEYDTSGDELPDVRKVFLTVGDGTVSRLVMICREADVNGDGRKDVVRYYDDEGRSLREESDRNFDGKMDLVTVYQNGALIRAELDDNHDGRIDSKVFYENGRPQRTERDLAGRSTAAQWKPDRWEYFEGGKMVRMGTDLDGDSRVDRWDRDAAWKREQEGGAALGAAAGSDG